MGWPDRSLSSNFVGNHLGHFAQSHHTFARSLFLGGVTERFPTLNFGFLEGGVGWACNLYGDLLGHWEKRNRAVHGRAPQADQPRHRRVPAAVRAVHRRATRATRARSTTSSPGTSTRSSRDTSQEELTERDLDSDDFARVHIDGPDDIRRLFAGNFYFGCEADDPDDVDRVRREDGPAGSSRMLGSDIAHFDVIDATEVLEEAYELVGGRPHHRAELPRVHLLQRRAALPRHEPVVLRRYRRRGGSRSRVREVPGERAGDATRRSSSSGAAARRASGSTGPRCSTRSTTR